MTLIHYLGRNDLDHTVILSINGARWEYHLSPAGVAAVDHLAHRISLGKALAYAKRHAIRSERLQ